MHVHFTEEDEPTAARAREVRAALVHAFHRVTRGRWGEAPPPGTDLWMVGLGWDHARPTSLPVRSCLAFRGDLVLFQVCDSPTMHFHRIPDEVAARTRWFLRNHWPSDDAAIPSAFRARIGWLPPMAKPLPLHAGRSLAERSRGALFHGSGTGTFFRLPDGATPREALVRTMRRSGLPFEGGLVPHASYAVPTDVVSPRIGAREHARRLRDARICLAPWGNHFLTYRLFEGFAARCLVVAQSLRKTRFLDGGLRAGVHYVEVAEDLSDLTDVVRHHLNDLDGAQRIADAGHAHHRRHFAYRGGLPSANAFDAAVASWGAAYRPVEHPAALARLRSFVARWASFRP